MYHQRACNRPVISRTGVEDETLDLYSGLRLVLRAKAILSASSFILKTSDIKIQLLYIASVAIL